MPSRSWPTGRDRLRPPTWPGSCRARLATIALRAISGPPVSLAEMRGISMDKSLSHEVIKTGEPISSEDMTQDRRAMTMDHIPGWPTIGPAIVVPLRTGSEVVGALALGWTPEHAYEYHNVNPLLPASFAEQAALALQMVRSRENERQLALFEDRDRIGRDLHDLVIQRLFAVGLSLQSVSRSQRECPRSTSASTTAVDDLDATIKDIRRSIFALGFDRGGRRHPDRDHAPRRAGRRHAQVPAHARDRGARCGRW